MRHACQVFSRKSKSRQRRTSMSIGIQVRHEGRPHSSGHVAQFETGGISSQRCKSLHGIRKDERYLSRLVIDVNKVAA